MDWSAMEAFGQFVKEVGFPIAVASFVLFRMNGTVGALKDAVKDLTAMLKSHLDDDSRVSDALRRRRRKP